MADCDDGYGGALQVARTVQAFERAGVAGVVIEDQASPKHCAFYAEYPLRLVDKNEMVAKLNAAVDARTDELTMIWARTDALAAGMGVAEALDRAQTYVQAGADAIFAPSKRLEDLAAYAAGWQRPEPLAMSASAFMDLTIDQVQKMGFAARSDLFVSILAGLRAIEDVMGEYLRTGSLKHAAARSKTLQEFEELVGVPLAANMERRYTA